MKRIGLALVGLLGFASIANAAQIEISYNLSTTYTLVGIGEHAAANLVDFQNGSYAGLVLKVDTRSIGERMARDLVDFQNGFYAGELP